MNEFEPGSALESRWRPGHRAFEVLLAAMILLLKNALRQFDSEDLKEVGNSLRELAFLLSAATAAMHFAADFESSVYQNQIRPTMSPPHMPPGFSGTLNQRHAEFLEGLHKFVSRIRSRFGNRCENAPPEIQEGWKSMLKAQSENLAAHGLICERFVPGGESLLQQHMKIGEKEKR